MTLHLFKRHALVLFAALLLTACQSKPTIESVPVQDIEISQQPPAPPIAQKQEPVTDSAGIRLPDPERRIYGAVIPVRAEIISATDKVTRFYSPGMRISDVRNFIEKYFPYQIINYYSKTDIFEIQRTIKDQYQDGQVVPDLNPNVFRPETPVYIRIVFDKERNNYIWIYFDPAVSERIRQQEEAKKLANMPPVAPDIKRSWTKGEVDKLCAACEESKFTLQSACEECKVGSETLRTQNEQ